MLNILYAMHRIPYPPDKGDKIRSWHILKHLTARHRVHLLAFVDDPDDFAHAGKLKELCASLCLRPLTQRQKLTRAVMALLKGRAITEEFYRDASARAFADGCTKAGIDVVLGYSGGVLHYLEQAKSARRLFDLGDVDSQKWHALAAQRSGPLAWLYRREARKIAALEQRALNVSDATIFVSDAEAALFKTLSPAARHNRIHAVSNGVDAGYFSPAKPAKPASLVRVVFVGAMDYQPNIDAVIFFANLVMPLLRQHNAVHFQIVGSKPAPAVKALARHPDIEVTGRVPDVRPYLAKADLVAAPLLLARGIQNKVLEAMAMAKPVVATEAAATGLDATHGQHLLIANKPEEFVSQINRLVEDPELGAAIGAAARDHVLAQFSWDARLAALDALLAGNASISP